jgi:hypothetical protein
MSKNNSKKDVATNSHQQVIFPTPIPGIGEDKARMLQIIQNEWRTIIETQMHFNDLIIRLRSIAITALTTLIGASLAIIKIGNLQGTSAVIVFLTPWLLWLVVFVLDFFYYHRLLMGSVHAAYKFDENQDLKSLGLFGLTTSITRSVTPPSSRWMIVIYYLVPTIIAIVVFALWRFKIISL